MVEPFQRVYLLKCVFEVLECTDGLQEVFKLTLWKTYAYLTLLSTFKRL